MRTFLNNLDDYIPQLINNKAINVIYKNVILDVNAFMLFGNEYAILNRIAQLVVKKMFQTPTLLNMRVCHINPQKETEGEFVLSEFHMEFELNEKSLEYIKSVIANKSISNRSFVFIIKNAESSINRNMYLALRRIIDINPTCKFIITTSSMAFMEKSLLSRVLQVNCSFPFQNVFECSLVKEAAVNSNISQDKMQEIYNDSNNNIITLLQHLGSNCQQLLWQKSIDNLTEMFKTEKKQLMIIMSIRETVYRLYHIGIPLKDVCHYVIKHNIKSKNIQNIVKLAAECEHGTSKGSKEILLYEKFFLNLYKFL